MIANGEARPLLGVPVTIKESFNLAGTATTWGLPFAKDYIAQEDALLVQRLKAAGAIIVGKTNVPPGLADWQSYNAIYGVTNHPYDLSRTPGGSSGGSAAALAAGYGPLSFGSDIGGSLRAPAHFCGVTAHKPSWGVVPTRGHTPPFAPSLPGDIDFAVAGPMARNASDLSLAFDVIAGPDPLTEGVGYGLALPPSRHERLGDFRILVLDEHPMTPTGADVRNAVAKVAQAAQSAGAKVEWKSDLLPDLAESCRLYMRLYRATLSVALMPDTYAAMQEAAKVLPADADDLVSERLRGAVFSHREWLITDGHRRVVQRQWRSLFKQFDAVICPIMPTSAFLHDHSPDTSARRLQVDSNEIAYLDMLVWPGVATLANLPATSLPAGITAEGLPVGVQIIGPALEDRTTLRLAALLEQEIGGFIHPKGLEFGAAVAVP
jgi:amidase